MSKNIRFNILCMFSSTNKTIWNRFLLLGTEHLIEWIVTTITAELKLYFSHRNSKDVTHMQLG